MGKCVNVKSEGGETVMGDEGQPGNHKGEKELDKDVAGKRR